MSNAVSVVRNTLALPQTKEQIAAALPKDVPVDRFIRNVMTVLTQNPALAEKCDQGSFFNAVMQTAGLGLMPDQQLGEAWLIPYKGSATLQIGVQGLTKLAWQSGMLESINTGVVRRNDSYELDEVEGTLRWSRAFGTDRGEPIFVFAKIKLKGGGDQLTVMDWQEVEKIRQGSPSANSPAWKTYPEEMAKKVCLKRALKRVPKATEAHRAIAIDDEIYQAEERDVTPPPQRTEPRPSSRLAQLKEEHIEQEEPNEHEAPVSDLPTMDIL